MQDKELVVRAIDVGYGHIKFTEGRHATTRQIRTDSIPSQSPTAKPPLTAGGVMNRRDTFIIPIGDRRYEVGRDVRHALHGNNESEVLDQNFALSDLYAARLFGALNYMAPGLPEDVIDVLVLGLPLNTFDKHREALEKRFTGTHVINERGEKILVQSCNVYPQPFGSYAAYMALNQGSGQTPMALSVDPGYNTVDWFVCKGMTANDIRSDAVQRGMGAVLRAIADDMIKTHNFDATPTELVRSIDRALSSGEPFQLYGQVFDLAPHLAAGKDIIEEAAQAVKNSVGSGSDIDVIIMTGGGASLYAEAIADKFPRHKVQTLESPALANVRGFHLVGEMLAKSRMRATAAQRAEAATA